MSAQPRLNAPSSPATIPGGVRVMQTNRTPVFDASDNPTQCCPRFKPEGWNDQPLRFANKPFARATTKSFLHMPLNMGAVFADAQSKIDAAKAGPGDQFVVLSRELSAWSAEHLFAVTGPVPGLEQTTLSGDYRTRVFEGPFQDAPKWCATFAEDLAADGECAERIYMFYTTCPKCAKAYGKNYVVAIAKLEEAT